MRMNAQPITRDAGGNHLADDLTNLSRQHPAIGITQHNPARAGIIGSVNSLQRIGRIGLIPIKKMFGIKQGFAVLCHHVLN